MKKAIICIILAFSISSSFACDICGCGVGGNYIGILPEFHKHIFGLRYRYSSLLTHVGAGGGNTYLTSRENYHTAELWGGWNIGKKFRIMAAIPYSFNERINQGIKSGKNGFGDISVYGYYQLLNKKRSINNKLLVQTLWIGGGIKLPTGKYETADKDISTQNSNLFQLGTGSADFTLNAMYDIRLQDAGLNINASYKMNTANKYEYNYGNKINSSAQLYYKLKIKKMFTVAPNLGITYERSKKDLDKKFTVDLSGGNLLVASAGIETSFNKISIGGNWQMPLSQKLANGFVKANNRLMVHLSVAL